VTQSHRLRLGVTALIVAAAVSYGVSYCRRCLGDEGWLACSGARFDPFAAVPSVISYAAERGLQVSAFSFVNAREVDVDGYTLLDETPVVEFALVSSAGENSEHKPDVLLDKRGVKVSVGTHADPRRQLASIPVCDTKTLVSLASEGSVAPSGSKFDIYYSHVGYVLKNSGKGSERSGERGGFLVAHDCKPAGRYVTVKGTLVSTFEDSWFIPCFMHETWAVTADHGVLPQSRHWAQDPTLPNKLMSLAERGIVATGVLSEARITAEFSKRLHVLESELIEEPCGSR
jgi:hypothetical protein